MTVLLLVVLVGMAAFAVDMDPPLRTSASCPSVRMRQPLAAAKSYAQQPIQSCVKPSKQYANQRDRDLADTFARRIAPVRPALMGSSV